MSRDLDLLEGLEQQLAGEVQVPPAYAPEPPPFDLSEYDRVCIFSSGGKDSLAATLNLLELGYPRDKIILHHHDVDGKRPAVAS